MKKTHETAATDKSLESFEELARKAGFTGSYRLTVCRKRTPKDGEEFKTPDQIWGIPNRESERLRICEDFSYDPERGLPTIYFVSALAKAAAGKDLKCMLMPSKKGNTITAFPIDYYLLGETVWSPRTEFTKIDLVFTREGDKPWSTIHPATGQRIIALSRDTDWKIEASSEKPNVSRKYPAGSLGMRYAGTTGVLIAGPYKVVQMASEGALVATEGEPVPDWVQYTYQPVFQLGEWLVPLFRIVGDILEISDHDVQELKEAVGRFRATLLSSVHPDLIAAAQLDDEDVDRLETLKTCEERFKQINEELTRLVDWLDGWMDYRKQFRKDASVFEKAGAPIPTLKLHPPVLPKGYELPKGIAEGQPLAYMPLEKITKLLFAPVKKRKPAGKTKPAAKETKFAAGAKKVENKSTKPAAKTTTKPAEPKGKTAAGTKGTTKASAPAPTTNGNGNGHPAAPLDNHTRMTSVADNLDAETKAKLEALKNGGDEPPIPTTAAPKAPASFRFVTCGDCGKKHKVAGDFAGSTTKCPIKKGKK